MTALCCDLFFFWFRAFWVSIWYLVLVRSAPGVGGFFFGLVALVWCSVGICLLVAVFFEWLFLRVVGGVVLGVVSGFCGLWVLCVVVALC